MIYHLIVIKLGSIQAARHKTEGTFLWNFHRDKTVELSVEFPRKVPQRLNRGTFCGNSTESSTGTKPWDFHWKLSISSR